jgi:hypothetical protein
MWNLELSQSISALGLGARILSKQDVSNFWWVGNTEEKGGRKKV